MYCIHCGTKRREEGTYCISCGQKLPHLNDVTHSNTATSLVDESAGHPIIEPTETTIEGSNEVNSVPQRELLSHFIGKNADKIFGHWNKGISFTILGLLFGVYYLAFRKMYKAVLLIVLIMLSFDGLLYVLDIAQNEIWTPIDSAVSIMVSLGCAFFFHPLYKKHTNEHVEEAKVSTSSPEELLHVLKKKGGTSILAVFACLGLFLLYGFLSYSLFPTNEDNISYVRDGSFYFEPTITVGEAFDVYFDEGTWSVPSHNSPYDVVLYQGTRGEYDIQVRFVLEDDSFELISFTVNEKTYTSDEDIDLFLSMVYGK
ncbi:DUF2628 domain-containing protein [Bacillus timonensis]|nr:DUF2628 domain-containing protein [Bacillus timonensis]